MRGNRPRLADRRRKGVLLHAGACVLLLPFAERMSTASRWEDPVLVGTLAVLAVLADRSDVPLPSGVRFDATLALMLIGVALAGPLPALIVYAAPVLVNSLTGHERLLRAGNLANLASAGWQVLAASALLEAAAFGSGPVSSDFTALLGGGAVLFGLGWLVGPAIYGPMWLGVPLRAMVDSLRDMRVAAGVMVVLGAVTVLSFSALGVAALALFALVAVLPQSALTYAARSRSVARLDPLTATRRYARAIGIQMGLTAAERREVDAVVRLAHERGIEGDPARHLAHAVADWREVSCAAGHVTEWWNGAGGPAGLPGALTPQSSRIVAVAQTWAALTAEGSPCLGHADALQHLDDAAGVRLDPSIVRAARAVLAQEPSSPAVPAPEPRLHHLGVPAPLRRVMAAGS